MHTAPFTLALTVWVPSGAARGAWLPCSLLGTSMTEELIKTCAELRSVLSAHGRLVARILSAPAAPRYDGFRILGRRKDTGLLVTSVEWARSRETLQLVQNGDVFTACEWVHPETVQLVA
ncbi:hypothetical protein SEA_EURATIS_48 [Streptomyces phage Euratis]|uniref:Uncharacterized protein n=1 Tax=Streptomyces phage Euratis TaxID=2510569 RepID=A0A411B131_9CAUD|nr:hypothetical protein SEA_EURATIS_48 [Streptomyces phage Euratis]